MKKQHLISKLADTIKQSAKINSSLFNEYGVKRGLCNDDGSSVLVGLTKIGNVVGYERMEDGTLKPIPGKLYYRGYDVEDLVHGFMNEKRFGFEEVVYLLLSGNLPDQEELREFNELLYYKMQLTLELTWSIVHLPGNDIMNILARSVLDMYIFDEKADDLSCENQMRQSVELISRFPTAVAYTYSVQCQKTNEDSLNIYHPIPDCSFAENLLFMLKKEYSDLEARILDLLLILQAEHGGGDNSTFTVRVTSSSMTDIYSSIAACIGSLKGLLNEGVDIQVVDMFNHLKENISNWKDIEEIDAYFARMLNKEVYNKTGHIYGICHAIYTISDPRVLLLRGLARELAKEKDRCSEFEFLELLEERAIETFSRVKNNGEKVSSNIDFYSGFVYDMIGLPTKLYTPLFAIARMAGWIAHRNEELYFTDNHIFCPAYKNVLDKKSYVPIDAR